MSQAPWTLFWPRSGFTPTPWRPRLPVAMARLAIAMTDGRALAVLGDAEAVIDRAIAAGRIEPRGAADRLGRHAGHLADRLRAVAAARTRTPPNARRRRGRSARARRPRSTRPSVTMTCASALSMRDIGAGPQRQVIVGLDMRHAHQVDAARVDRRSAWRPARSRFFMREANTGWASVGLAPITRITSALLDGVEILRAGRRAERRLQAIAGRRVADAGAGVDVVVAEAAADQLLHQVRLLVGAARGGDAADRVASILAPGCA